MVTAYASVENAITAMKRGAFDYITKPFKNDEVLVILRNALERRHLVNENRTLRQNLQEQYNHFDNIVGRGPAMRRVFDLDHPGGAEPVDDSDSGRERHGQGAGGARHPHALAAQGSRVRHGELGQPSARPARVDALRPREGRVHRRRVSEEGALRPGRQGQHLPRRDRQHPARDPGQAAARDAGARVHAAGRHGSRSRWTCASSLRRTSISGS